MLRLNSQPRILGLSSSRTLTCRLLVVSAPPRCTCACTCACAYGLGPTVLPPPPNHPYPEPRTVTTQPTPAAQPTNKQSTHTPHTTRVASLHSFAEYRLSRPCSAEIRCREVRIESFSRIDRLDPSFPPLCSLKLLAMPRVVAPQPGSPASQGPRGIGCDPAGHQALRLLATTCLPLGRQHERQLGASAAVPGSGCSCLRPAGAPPAGCVLQTTYHRGDGLGAQMYIRQSHLLEAAQLGCTYADTPLDARFAGKLAHATVASEVRAFFNLGSATAHGACPADAPPQPREGKGLGGPQRRNGRREWCESRSRDMRADPKAAARLRRAATSGAWCASAYPSP